LLQFSLELSVVCQHKGSPLCVPSCVGRVA
jgi:hypothetical protein